MEPLNNLDSFLIDITISDDRLGTAALLISRFFKITKGSIHIIDYYNVIHGYFTISDEKNEEFIQNTKDIIPKLKYPKLKKDIQSIIDYLASIDSEDIILINGADRLISCEDASKIYKTSYGNTHCSMYVQSDLNWGLLTARLDDIYSHYQTKVKGIITIIYSDIISRDIILDLLRDSDNMSITSTSDPYKEYKIEYIHKEIMSCIASSSLQEAISKIQENREVIGEINSDLLLSNAYYKNGDLHKAVGLFEKHFENLNNNQKLHLANMYRLIGVISKSEEILMQLEMDDCYLNNLYEAILDLYEISNPKFSYWIKKAVEINPTSTEICEKYAQYLTANEKYQEAAAEYRKLEKIMNTGYYEVLARVYEVIESKCKSINEMLGYVLSVPSIDTSTRNKAILILATYCEEVYKSDYLCYNILRNGVLELNCDYAQEIIIKKISVLKDLKRASRALGKLKPQKKEKHAIKLSNARTHLIIEAIQILGENKIGYLHWRDLLDSEQETTWLRFAYVFLKSKKDFFDNIESKMQESYILNTEKQKTELLGDNILQKPQQSYVNTIRVLRRVKMNEFDYKQNCESDDAFIQSVMTIAEVNNNWRMRIIFRYHLSIIFTNRGKHQIANNNALSILECSDNDDVNIKALALYLGLLSWGYSQYRIGRKDEGILCVLASMKYCILSNEIIPFLEEGVNIIGRFLVDCDCIKEEICKEIELWIGLSESLKHYNPSMNKLLMLYFNNNEDFKITLINNIETETGDWTGDFVNLISLCIKQGNEKSAIDLIVRKGIHVANLLENRKDIRFKVLYNWAWIMLGYIEDNPPKYSALALYFIDLAYKDLEEKRMVGHKEERGTIGEESKRIQKLYLDICCCIIQLNIEINISDYLHDTIDKLLLNLAPRSVIEQKIQYSIKTDKTEYVAVEQEYRVLVDEYSTMKKNKVDISIQSEAAKKIASLQNKLKSIHPNYMELKEYRMISISEIQHYLVEDEVLYVNILTKIGVYELIITAEHVLRNYRLIDIDVFNVSDMTIKFSEMMQQGEKNYNADDTSHVIHEISHHLFSKLLQYSNENKISTLYHMLDYEIGMFPLACVQNEKFSLIDKVESLIRIMDFSILLNEKPKAKMDGIINRVFGNNEDPELQQINKFINDSITDQILCDANENDDYSTVMKIIENHPFINTVIIYGHGSSNPLASKTEGAYGIEGKGKIIYLDRIIQDLNIDNLIIISCSTGTITGNSVEKSTGALINVLERYTGSFIICKWDVNTRITLEFINSIISNSIKQDLCFEKAFFLAQKEIREKLIDMPFYWAGLELWIN